VTTPAFQDEPPQDSVLTPYDRTHMTLYMRLLDAARDGADWRDAVRTLFGVDAGREPQRARRVHDAHLARARWMTETGYRQLVRESGPR
jgi:transposase